jgi:hypothetical protein
MNATRPREHAERQHRRAGGTLAGRLDETERYRQAADDALQQLDWCIGYLHGIRKVHISRALARNRSFIRRNLLNRPEEPLPTAADE